MYKRWKKRRNYRVEYCILKIYQEHRMKSEITPYQIPLYCFGKETLRCDFLSGGWRELPVERNRLPSMCLRMLRQSRSGPLSAVLFTHHKPVYYIDIQTTQSGTVLHARPPRSVCSQHWHADWVISPIWHSNAPDYVPDLFSWNSPKAFITRREMRQKVKKAVWQGGAMWSGGGVYNPVGD